MTDQPTPASPPSPSVGMEEDPYAATPEVIDYVLRYGGMCRGCADEDGVCPRSGLPCDVPLATKAVQSVLEAIAYGREHGYLAQPATVAVEGEK